MSLAFCRNCGNTGCTMCAGQMGPERLSEGELDALLDIIEQQLLDEPAGAFGIRTRTGAVILVQLSTPVDPSEVRVLSSEVVR